MALKRNLYRLTGLDGAPHHVLDAPYESIDAALFAAKSWCNGQGLKFQKERCWLLWVCPVQENQLYYDVFLD